MRPAQIITRAAVLAALLVSLPLLGQQPYHLELQASPAAPFPWLCKFGDVELHVYSGGVRAEALWLDAISRNGAPDVTVLNPLGRMYVDVPVAEIPAMLQKLATGAAGVERAAVPTLGPTMKGKVGDVEATRHRLVYGPAAWIDVWTTSAVPENPQLKRLVGALLEGISPGTARVASKLAGVPVYVELNFTRFRKLQLLKLKKLTMSADDEKDALTRGPLYVRAPLLEKLFER